MANQTRNENKVASAVKATPVMSKLHKDHMLRRAHSVDPEVRKFIARESLRSQVVRKQKSYYSAVRFPFDVAPVPVAAGASPTQWTYTLNKKKIIAFSYGISDDMTAAGFPQGYVASEAETNLISKGDTGGAVVEIHGISLHLDETSDAKLAKYLWSRTFVDITLDGSTRYVLLGRMGRLASPGGLYGAGQSFITPPGLTESVANVGVLTNGMPHANNFYKLNEKIRWNPSSKIDSKFQIRFEVTRDIQFTVGNRAAAPGVTEYDPPTNPGDEGTYVDVVVYLHTHEIAPRTTQQ
jgi:hypothetical protein